MAKYTTGFSKEGKNKLDTTSKLVPASVWQTEDLALLLMWINEDGGLEVTKKPPVVQAFKRPCAGSAEAFPLWQKRKGHGSACVEELSSSHTDSVIISFTLVAKRLT